ncbi:MULTISPECIES: winged helix-turn-helix transcriptional regulator [Prauserella salsuginis group]|uniref:DNA-binding HxlR family transcriptional regulator n=2 Tax=Prauserella salsuginis group TaxID=2893672 RepID=A0A839XIG9_9PSEU|nr:MULTISPECIES: helix-turn-helix domain-containing protein [Prauserella salsuginis group]MBB3663070.1 DNA-binding HxlR family transcriptional regulator [Prauserella sediminis]MCR3721096.1 transcriptional regulator, HxlR family [Prauserella flava]MCR3734823.1 transcriptional regulator, HxlR family [Prauserella salsuginis]
MGKRQYGQFCGLVRAVELVGERWALLIVRDLLVAPKRYTDLKRGLPRIPTNVLSARLKELETAGIVERRLRPRPDGSVEYALTEYGADLEDAVLAFGRWGARALGEPGPDEIITSDSLVIALRTAFLPEAAAEEADATYEIRLGDVVVHARVDGGELVAGTGEADGADLVIETGPAFRALLAGELAPDDAVADGSVAITGPKELLAAFTRSFRI